MKAATLVRRHVTRVNSLNNMSGHPDHGRTFKISIFPLFKIRGLSVIKNHLFEFRGTSEQRLLSARWRNITSTVIGRALQESALIDNRDEVPNQHFRVGDSLVV